MIPLRETRHEQMIMGVFLGVVALLPVVAVFSHRAAAVMVLLMGLAAGTRMEPWRKGTSAFVFRPDMKQPLVLGVIAFILFCLWILLSSRWSPQPGGAKLALNVFAPVIGSGVIVWEVLRRPAEKTYRLAKIFAYAVLVSLGLLIFEIVSGGPMRDIVPPRDLSPERFKDMTALGRGSTLVMFAAFPAWLILVRRFEHAEKDIGAKRSKLLRYSAPVVLSLLIIYATLRLGIFSNAAGVVVGGVAAFAAARAPRRTLWALLITALLFLTLSPLSAWLPVEAIIASHGDVLPPSWAQRLYAWRAAAQAGFECMPFGCGADAARALHATGAVVNIPGSAIPLSVMPIHPHNVFLQIWMELGAAGLGLFGIAIFGGGLALIRASLPAAVAAGAAGAIGAVLVSVLVEASLWQVWRLSAAGLAALGVALSYSFNLKEVEWGHRGFAAHARAHRG